MFMRFTLRQLFGTLTILGVVFGAFVWFGWYTLLFVPVAIPAQLWVLGRLQWVDAAFAGGGLGLLGCLLLPAFVFQKHVQSNSSAARTILYSINSSLKVYELDHGGYPPPITYDHGGRPMHSWRAHLKDYWDVGPELASGYDWSELWNEPPNDGLHPQKWIFGSPYRSSPHQGEACYLAVIVPNAEPGERFAIIEVPESNVKFLEPRDLHLEELLDPVHGPAKRAALAAPGLNFVNVLWPSGDVEKVDLEELPSRLQELLKARETSSGE